MNNVKKRILAIALVMVSLLTIVPMSKVQAAEYYYGGLEYAWADLPVYSSTSWTNRIGTIYKNESFTVLLQEGPSGYLWVEYSTSSGAKRGYVRITPDELGGRTDGLGRARSKTNVYYGTDTSTFLRAGSVNAGEIVVIIAKNGDWVYIEYNTTSGRKRGYMSYSSLEILNRPGTFPDLFTYNTSGTQTYYSGKYTVYSGPTTLYSTVGSINSENVIRYGSPLYIAGRNAMYIEYYVNGTNQKKSGFIIQ